MSPSRSTSGQIYGLIGPNGAGKTTLFNLLTGIYAPDAGSFLFAGRDISGFRPDRVAAAGIARTFQNIRLFANLSALENVMIGRHVRTRAGVIGAVLRSRSTLKEEKDIERRSLELLDYVGIRARANDAAGNLPYGDQRRLEIARALATEPEAARARRAGGGHEPDRAPRAGRAGEAHPRRRRHDPAHRARRASGDECLRPRDGARLRRDASPRARPPRCSATRR